MQKAFNSGTSKSRFTTAINTLATMGLIMFMVSVANAKKITVEGMGHDEKSALRNALRNAVEQGTAEYLKEKGLEISTILREIQQKAGMSPKQSEL